MTKTEIIVTIFLGLIASGGFWGFLQFLLERRAKKKKHTIEEVLKRMDEMEEKLDSNTELTVANARDRLNHLSNTFMEQGYIPRKEIVSYTLLGDAYCKKHNSEVKTRYEWCINNLEVR